MINNKYIHYVTCVTIICCACVRAFLRVYRNERYVLDTPLSAWPNFGRSISEFWLWSRWTFNTGIDNYSDFDHDIGYRKVLPPHGVWVTEAILSLDDCLTFRYVITQTCKHTIPYIWIKYVEIQKKIQTVEICHAAAAVWIADDVFAHEWVGNFTSVREVAALYKSRG